jgi:uncharacterized protein DUF5335
MCGAVRRQLTNRPLSMALPRQPAAACRTVAMPVPGAKRTLATRGKNLAAVAPRLHRPRRERAIMPTTEVTRAEWDEFLLRFTRAHEGWLCSMAVMGPGRRLLTAAHELPLVSIRSDHGSAGAPIRVVLGTVPEAYVTHAIDAPAHVYVERDDEGEDRLLAIECRGGRRTLIALRIARPEADELAEAC